MGRSKPSILADVFEAFLGAVYLDGGLSIAKSFLIYHFESEFESAIGSPPRNYKAELQDYSQKEFQKIREEPLEGFSDGCDGGAEAGRRT